MNARLDPRPQELPRAPTCASWQHELQAAITDPAELYTLLGLDPADLASARSALADFPLRVPREFVTRMRHGDARDPLLLQVLPVSAELQPSPGFGLDPVGDLASRAGTAGLLHKYQGRALLVTTGACAVHCRYCFRRHFPYADESPLAGGWRATFERLRADPSIEELILSGGDPLSLSDRRLTQLTDGLACLPQIKRLRLHTRYPIVLPARVDTGLLNWLTDLPLQKVVVVHANHANELNEAVRSACRNLSAAGATLLNQSVLLAGVNDSVQALAELSEALFAAGVLPYYLHLLDRVQGAAHFEVAEPVAVRLHAELMGRLPGYLVPRLVREVPGAPSKTPVTLDGGDY